MAVYDRWHKTHPKLDDPEPDPELNANDKPCKCGRGKNRLYPTAVHGCGKRWQVRWRDDDGEQVKRNFAERYGDDPERHAEALNAKVNADLDSGAYVDPAAGKTTLEEFAKQWRSGVTADPSTLANLDLRLAHIHDVEAGPKSRRAEGSSAIAKMTMGSLAKNPSAVQRWVKSLEKKGLSPGYIKQIFDTLSSIFIAAIDNGVAARNPTKAQSVRLPTIAKKTIVPWTSAMVTAAATVLADDKDAAGMVWLGAGAGLRQGEIFGIAEGDIEFLGKDRKIHVRRQVKLIGGVLVFAPPKGDKERVVPLSAALGRQLSAQIKSSPPRLVTLPWRTPDSKKTVTAKLLFVRPDGRPWHRQTFTYTWHKARRAAGAEETPENGMHILRHTFASVTLAGGVDILKLAAWLGHEDPGFTLRTYTHLMPDATDKGRASVDAFIEPPESTSAGPSALDVPSGGDS